MQKQGVQMAKILMIEDNEMNRDALSRRLERNGYEVVTAVQYLLTGAIPL